MSIRIPGLVYMLCPKLESPKPANSIRGSGCLSRVVSYGRR